MNARYDRSENRPTGLKASLADNQRWCGVIEQRLQVPLQRLTQRERLELLACLGKLERTATEFQPPEARSLRIQLRDKLAHESGDALAEALDAHTLAAWTRWTEQVLRKPTPEVLWEMLTALDDTEAAVAIVAGYQPQAIEPGLDDLLSQCRTWVELHGELFASLRVEIERLLTTLQPDLAEANYDLGVTLVKFEAILDPIPSDDAADNVPAPFTSAVIDALLPRTCL